MAHYEYTALSTAGQKVRGVLAAPSEQAVIAELESRQLTPVAIEARGDGRPAGGGISVRALAESYGQLADLLHAGVPLLRGLKLLGARKAKPRLAQVFRELAEQVEKGVELATAMSERPGAFPSVHVAMVRAGEKGGFLEKVFSRLGAMTLAQAELRAQVIGSLVYPAILGVMGTVIAGVIFGFFVPKFRETLSSMGGELPMVTKVVFGMSDAMTQYGLFTATGLGLAVAGVFVAARTPRVRAALEDAKLNAPIIGKLVKTHATSRFCQLLGTMLDNGVPMLAALHIAKDGTGNVVMSRAIAAAADAVKAGQHLAVPLEESKLFEDDVIEMIRMGEAANNLDEVLLKVATTIEGRLSRGLQIATKLIEPLVLVVIGVVVLTVAMALILPLVQASSNIG